MQQPELVAMSSERRWVVLGISGSGKSTLARALAQALHAPHVELDVLFWGPQWTPKPEAVFRELAAAAVHEPAWVVDGNYSRVRDIVWPRATTAVWLNYPLWFVFWRVLRRTVRRLLRREILWHGNRESFARAFCSRESVLWWVLTAYRRRQREFAGLQASGAFSHLTWIELRRPAQAQALLEAARKGHRTGAASSAGAAPT